MGQRLLLAAGAPPGIPHEWSSWTGLSGSVVARSRTTRVERVRAFDLDLHLKRHCYPLDTALRAVLRHTFLRTSRAAREFAFLEEFRQRTGVDTAPAPLALGERRSFHLLRETFLATVTVPGAEPIAGTEDPELLGGFLSRLRRAGLVHGRLFARNLLVRPDGSFAVVDLDRARLLAPARSRAFWAADLTRLLASAHGLHRDALLRSFLDEEEDRAAWEQALDHHRIAAEKQILRRTTKRG